MLQPPTLQQLHEARERFRELLAASAPESEFQALFAGCPYVLSESLPLRLNPADYQPLARPGKSEPDFIFYPRAPQRVHSFGVIELKRPDTTLLTVPRKDVVLLSRDAATAVAQGQQYCRALEAELATWLTSNVIIGSNAYAFIIAGMSDELVRKLGSGAILKQVQELLPAGAQIIPYDELLRRFESTLPPKLLYFLPIQRPSVGALERIVAQAQEQHMQRAQINDENMDFWGTIEDRWRAGAYIGTSARRIIERSYWCIVGTDILATESPAHLDFPLCVNQLLNRLLVSLALHRQLADAQMTARTSLDLQRILTPRQLAILDEMVLRCREATYHNTFADIDDEDVAILRRLGLIEFSTIESSDAWFNVDPVLIQLWR